MGIGASMATIDDFMKIELRVAKILAVDDLPTRKPMYGLELDLGELGTRRIAAGIKRFYTREQLLGRSIIVVANLEPKKVGDFVSEGMLLAAEDDAGDVVLLGLDRPLPPGSRIH